MEYFKINYNKLENLPQFSFFRFVMLLIIILMVIILNSFSLQVSRKLESIGIIQDNKLVIKIESSLSEKIKSCEYLVFNEKKSTFEISEFGEYEIIDNKIYQEVELIVDEVFLNNEIGSVEFHYEKISIFKYILDLFN